MFKPRNWAGIGLLAALAACQQQQANVATTPAQVTSAPAATPVAPAPAPAALTAEQLDEALMLAVFGTAYRATTKDAIREMQDPTAYTSKRKFRAKAYKHTVLRTGETVLIATSELAEGIPGPGAASGKDVFISAYFLREAQDKWALLRSHENLTGLSGKDGVGNVSFLEVGKGKEGMAVVYENRWENCSTQTLALYDLADPAMHMFFQNMAIGSSFKGLCVGDGRYSDFAVTTKWHMAQPKSPAPYDDLIQEFSGYYAPSREIIDGKPVGPAIRQKMAGAVRWWYVAKDKMYNAGPDAMMVPTVESEWLGDDAEDGQT